MMAESKLKTTFTEAVKPVTDLHEQAPAKVTGKYVRSIFGALIFIGAFLMPKYLDVHPIVSYIVAGFGAFMISQELVTRYAKVLPASILAVVKALQGKPNGGQ